MTATNTTLVASTLTESIATLDPEIAQRIVFCARILTRAASRAQIRESDG